LIHAEAMPAALGIQDYESWIAQYPRSESLYQQYFDFLLQNGTLNAATQVLDRYQKGSRMTAFFRFARGRPLRKAGSAGGAIAVYAAAFDLCGLRSC